MSSASRLYADALHSIMAFLDLSELIVAAPVCKSWHAATSSMPTRGFSFRLHDTDSFRAVDAEYPSLAWLRCLSTSPLRHQLRELTLTAFLNLNALPLLHSLSHLRKLSMRIYSEDAEEAVANPHLAFPPSVTHLTLTPLTPARSWECPSELLTIVSRSPQLSTLHVRTRSSHPSLDLSPLLQLRHLTDLWYELNPTDEQMVVLRQLKLRRLYLALDVNPSSVPERMRTLAIGRGVYAADAPSFFPELTRLDFEVSGNQLTAEILSQLQHYPALQSLPGSQAGMDMRALDQLVHLRSLTTLHIERMCDINRQPEEDGAILVDFSGRLSIHAQRLTNILLACPSLAHLRRLTLWQVHSLSDEITDLLFSAMSALEDLSLMKPEGLVSLRFLQHLRRLRCLELDFDKQQPSMGAADLKLVFDLPALAYLSIRELEDGMVPTAMFPSFVLPFARCPSLRCLVYNRLQRSNGRASVWIQLPEGNDFTRVLGSLRVREEMA